VSAKGHHVGQGLTLVSYSLKQLPLAMLIELTRRPLFVILQPNMEVISNKYVAAFSPHPKSIGAFFTPVSFLLRLPLPAPSSLPWSFQPSISCSCCYEDVMLITSCPCSISVFLDLIFSLSSNKCFRSTGSQSSSEARRPTASSTTCHTMSWATS
jgi:hypothetical protein